MKGKIFSIFAYNKFTFGDQIVSQFVIFECKWLFSIIIFYFHKSDSSQDRFHTHAFNALSIKLFGRYTEYLLTDENTGEYKSSRRNTVLKYFPRDSYHKIGNSNGCATILISGRWKKHWKEFKDNKIINYNWNRKIK